MKRGNKGERRGTEREEEESRREGQSKRGIKEYRERKKK